MDAQRRNLVARLTLKKKKLFIFGSGTQTKICEDIISRNQMPRGERPRTLAVVVY
jgi:hypothetical protein